MSTNSSTKPAISLETLPLAVEQTPVDVGTRPDEEMARLEAAAEAGDAIAFLEARKAIDWATRPAEDFARAARWALAVGAHLVARQLATEGAERYPDHAELGKMAHVLAPPKVIRSDLPPDPSGAADIVWLREHGDEYRGQWVALRNGQLLGTGKSLDDLVRQIGDIKGVLLAPIA